MPTEINFCIDTETGEEETVGEGTVKSGEIFTSEFLAPAKVLILCELEDGFGSVIVSDDKEGQQTEIQLFENINDQEGKAMGTRVPIKISEKQFLVIWSNVKNRQIYVYHEREENFDSKITPIDTQPVSI